jgi:hypothetical protein
MPAAAFAKDWAAGSFSAVYQLSPRTVLQAGISTVIGNPQVTSYGTELGISNRF